MIKHLLNVFLLRWIIRFGHYHAIICPIPSTYICYGLLFPGGAFFLIGPHAHHWYRRGFIYPCLLIVSEVMDRGSFVFFKNSLIIAFAILVLSDFILKQTSFNFKDSRGNIFSS
jgi:hypothetical protein